MNNTKDFLVWLWQYLRVYKAGLVVAFVGIFLFSLSNTAAVIYVFYEFVQQWESGSLGQQFAVSLPDVPYLLPEGAEWVLASGSPGEMVNQLIPYIVALILVRVVSDFIRLFVMRYVSICVGRDIRSQLYENMIYRPITYFEQNNVGDLIGRLSSDIDKVKKTVSSGLRNLVQSPLELLMAVAVVTYAAPLLSAFFLIIPFCGWLIYKVGDRIKRYSRATQDVMGGLLSMMQERFTGIKLVKSAGREDVEVEDFNRENDKHFRKQRRKIVVDSGLRPMMHLLIFSIGIGVAYVAFLLIQAGYLNVAALGTFIFSIPWIYKPLRKISGLNDTIQTARGAAERIQQVFEESTSQLVDLESGDRSPSFDSEIEFKDVSYSYPNYEEEALSTVSLTLERGKNLALVGPSGAGKSTFTDLLLRFFDPTEGKILLDGVELPKYRLKEYRKLFGLVTQHPVLFNNTIAENIRYGRRDISLDQVKESAGLAEAKEFIEELPDGFRTNVGEQGVRLSGGERQRIALARALAGDPKILVLDEATSNVDSRSEKKIVKALENLPESISLVTISHALATVQFATRIVVLNDHQIEAVGEHEDLVQDSPTYRELYEHQVDELETAFR